MPSQTKAIVVIGGGKAIDYCKYIAFMNQVPLISVPTIISNDGFCSPMSSLQIHDKRKTFKTVLPYGVIVDTNAVLNAPEKYIYSGIGELFSKITSLFDWKLSFKKTGEYINDFASTICRNGIDSFIYYDNKDIKNPEYIKVIASALLMNGIAMEIAKSSRPASGSEHLISHAYDRVASEPTLHGIQVGVASYAVSYLQEFIHQDVKNALICSKFFDYVKEIPLNRAEFIEAIKLAPQIKENFYTILSERNATSYLLEFIENDDLMNQMLV